MLWIQNPVKGWGNLARSQKEVQPRPSRMGPRRGFPWSSVGLWVLVFNRSKGIGCSCSGWEQGSLYVTGSIVCDEAGRTLWVGNLLDRVIEVWRWWHHKYGSVDIAQVVLLHEYPNRNLIKAFFSEPVIARGAECRRKRECDPDWAEDDWSPVDGWFELEANEDIWKDKQAEYKEKFRL